MAEEAFLKNVQLVYALQRAPMAGCVLHVGAHPDDEDAGMLAVMSRGKAARAVYWSATRGEGAQNFIGPDRNEGLGIVRTWESQAAREYDGGEVLYGPFVDFGFTKTGEFALAKWGHEAMVREIVRAIRSTQPAVIVNRWSGTEEDGHGHHQAVGLVSEEAFEAAADPKLFPELNLPPWSALKLYHSMGGDWQPGQRVRLGHIIPDYEERNLLRINSGELDPISGHTFQELAWKGYNRHQSQALGFVPQRGDFFFYYDLDRSRVGHSDAREVGFFDGIDVSLTGLPGWPGLAAGRVAGQLSDAAAAATSGFAEFHPADPARSAPSLLAALAAVRSAVTVLTGSPDPETAALTRLLRRKEEELEWAVARCLDLELEAGVVERLVTPGSQVGVWVRLRHQGRADLESVQLGVESRSGWPVPESGPTEADRSSHRAEYMLEVPVDAEFSCPYWLREPNHSYRYVWPDDDRAGLPLDPPEVEGTATVVVAGQSLRLRTEALFREAFGGGYRELPLAVLPPIALAPERTAEFLPRDGITRGHQLRLALRCTQEGGARGELVLQAPDGWEVSPPRMKVDLSGRGDVQTVVFDLRIPGAAAAGRHRLDYLIRAGRRQYGATLHPVRSAAPGLARPADERTCVLEAFITGPASADIRLVEVEFVRKLAYGYVTGASEEVLSTLRHFELDLSELDDEFLEFGDLDRFDAIVVGPNAYLIRDGLRTQNERLLAYARAGGTVIVQHQGYGFEGQDFAPFPFTYHQPHDRVSFEDAPVMVLQPDHPILHIPNEITTADWEGWVKDRGMYFFREFDNGYVPIVASHDPGESPQEGGLLVADVGQGTWVYCAYSLWKQIPTGIPGGFRLFANLLALPHSRILRRSHLLTRTTLFGFMSDEQRYDIARLMSDRRLEDGEILCRQGDPGDEMYVIVEGEVEVVKTTPANPEGAVIAVAGPGDAIGELSVLASQPRSATMRARGDARLLAIWGPAFRKLVHTTPDIADRLIETLVDKLATTGLSP